MQEDEIQKNIASALQEIVAGEKLKFQNKFDKSDEEGRQRVEKLKPLLTTLEVIRGQIEPYKDMIDISIPEFGHMASVGINGGSSRHLYSISTNYGFGATAGNEHFTVEESNYYSFSGESFEKKHRFKTADEVIRLVMEAIGNNIALKQTVDKRNQKKKAGESGA